MKKIIFLLPLLFLVIGTSLDTIAQKRKIKRPKKCNIKTVDRFVGNSFRIYRKVYVYDSLTVAGVEIPEELENEIFESLQTDVDSMIMITPDIWDSMKDEPLLKQAKGGMNLGKASRALTFSLQKVKAYTLGEASSKEGDEDDDDYYDDGKY